jgi:hypothetical protein
VPIFSWKPIVRAVQRARVGILSVALTYLGSVLIGAIMVHSGNTFALSWRDRLVSRAQSTSILRQYSSGRPWSAATLDFSANLLLGGVSSTIVGKWVTTAPYPIALYRGWIGGIVSVDGHHISRFATPKGGAYFISVLLLQLLPYSLTGGAGVNIGLARTRPAPYYQGPKWWGIPAEALRDTFRIYVLAVPLFFLASLWEFLSPWN